MGGTSPPFALSWLSVCERPAGSGSCGHNPATVSSLLLLAFFHWARVCRRRGQGGGGALILDFGSDSIVLSAPNGVGLRFWSRSEANLSSLVQVRFTRRSSPCKGQQLSHSFTVRFTSWSSPCKGQQLSHSFIDRWGFPTMAVALTVRSRVQLHTQQFPRQLCVGSSVFIDHSLHTCSKTMQVWSSVEITGTV